MATDPQSLANIYQDMEEVAKVFGRIVYNTICHTNFKPDEFDQHSLFLCEAYCLLWQDAGTGQVDGRKVGIPLKVGVFAALFIDLAAASKIEVFKNNHDDEPMFRVIDQNATESFLDVAIFDSLRSADLHGRLREAKLWKWLIRAEDAECVENTFDSLVIKGILKEKPSGLFGIFKRFPTRNPLPEKKLEEKIKNIAFNKESPDSYMLSLLILSRESDQIFLCSDPILKKHFTSLEYKEAKKTLDQILMKHLKI